MRPICGLCGSVLKLTDESYYDEYRCSNCSYYIGINNLVCNHCLSNLIILPDESHSGVCISICLNKNCPNKQRINMDSDIVYIYENNIHIIFNLETNKGLIYKHGCLSLSFGNQSIFYKLL